MNDKVALEVAENELDQFFTTQDLDLDDSTMNQEEKDTFASQKRVLIRAMQRRALTFNDKGLPVFKPSYSDVKEPLNFRRPNGSAFLAMDGSGKGKDVHKLYAAMATMWGTHKSTFSNMDTQDLKVAQTISLLFLV